MATHYDIIHRRAVGSTQDVARDAARATGRPTLVIADRQTEGRGRQGRTWLQPDAAVFSSLSLRCSWPSDALALLPLATGVAVRSAIVDASGPAPDLKWPNDLITSSRKVGGILVEGADGQVTIGCGVNLRWDEPPDYAGAVFHDAVPNDAGQRIARGWVERILEVVDRGPDAWPRRDYEAACVTLDRRVRWDDGEGFARALDHSGGLVVDTPDGPRTLVSGDVHLLADG